MNNSLLIVLALIFALLLTSCSGSSIGSNHVNSVCESSQINLSSEDQDPSSEDSSFEEKSSVEELTSDSEQPPFSGVDYLTCISVTDNEKHSMILRSIIPSPQSIDIVFELYNKTQETLVFTVPALYINGCDADSKLSVMVPGGKKALRTISVRPEILVRGSVDSIDELIIPLSFYVLAGFDVETTYKTYKVYPTGKTPGSIKPVLRQPQPEDVVLVDNERCNFVIYEKAITDAGDLVLKCYIRNKTKEAFAIDWDNVFVNDYMCDPYFYIELSGGTYSYTEIRFDGKNLFYIGSAPYEIEALIRCYDAAAWNYPDYFCQDISLAIE